VSFDVFICYKRLSAQDFAEILKKSLEEFGVHTFLDIKDIPERFKGTEEWTNAIDKAIVESSIFVLIITAGFDLSPEVKRELTLARKCGDKDFVYFRHDSLRPNLKIMLEKEELILGKQQQVAFSTKNDLVRKAHSILVEGQDVTAVANEQEEMPERNVAIAISNFAAFYDLVFGARKVQKVYPKLFTAKEMVSPGKADKICRVLETYMDNKAQFKQAIQTIINLHREHSLKNIDALKEIVTGLGFVVGDDLSLSDMKKLSGQNSIKEIVKKYHDAVLDTDTNDPLPFKACPECGSTKLERSSMLIGDDYFFTIKCTECGWTEGSE
jgi:hypothetical protein